MIVCRNCEPNLARHTASVTRKHQPLFNPFLKPFTAPLRVAQLLKAWQVLKTVNAGRRFVHDLHSVTCANPGQICNLYWLFPALARPRKAVEIPEELEFGAQRGASTCL